jgi:hypothetical protein
VNDGGLCTRLGVSGGVLDEVMHRMSTTAGGRTEVAGTEVFWDFFGEEGWGCVESQRLER